MQLIFKQYRLIFSGLLAVGLASCNGLLFDYDRSEDTVEDPIDVELTERIGQTLNTDGDSRILFNEGAGIALTLPQAWSEDLRLHESAELQASDADNQLYMVVVAEDDTALNQLRLPENSENYRRLLISQMQDFDDQSKTDLAFIDSNFVSQYEIRGDVSEETPVVYLHTTVRADNRYYQIVAWTNPEQYSAYRSELQTITETFREIDADSDI